MLDAYIIERIRREQEERSRNSASVPLHIEVPKPSPPSIPTEEDNEPGDRGSVDIDFQM